MPLTEYIAAAKRICDELGDNTDTNITKEDGEATKTLKEDFSCKMYTISWIRANIRTYKLANYLTKILKTYMGLTRSFDKDSKLPSNSVRSFGWFGEYLT